MDLVWDGDSYLECSVCQDGINVFHWENSLEEWVGWGTVSSTVLFAKFFKIFVIRSVFSNCTAPPPLPWQVGEMITKWGFVMHSLIIKKHFEKDGSVECLLTVCFSAECSPGQEIGNREHKNVIYRGGLLSQSQKLPGQDGTKDLSYHRNLGPWIRFSTHHHKDQCFRGSCTVY